MMDCAGLEARAVAWKYSPTREGPAKWAAKPTLTTPLTRREYDSDTCEWCGRVTGVVPHG